MSNTDDQEPAGTPPTEATDPGSREDDLSSASPDTAVDGEGPGTSPADVISEFDDQQVAVLYDAIKDHPAVQRQTGTSEGRVKELETEVAGLRECVDGVLAHAGPAHLARFMEKTHPDLHGAALIEAMGSIKKPDLIQHIMAEQRDSHQASTEAAKGKVPAPVKSAAERSSNGSEVETPETGAAVGGQPKRPRLDNSLNQTLRSLFPR